VTSTAVPAEPLRRRVGGEEGREEGWEDKCKARAPWAALRLLLAPEVVVVEEEGKEGGREGGGGGPRVKGERMVLRIMPVRPCCW
jgi:hypothetical protein